VLLVGYLSSITALLINIGIEYRQNVDDLQKFYDRYCKNVDNGWEKDTPPVRLTLISFGGKDVVERPEQEVRLSYTHKAIPTT